MKQLSRVRRAAYVCLLVVLGFTLGCSEFIVIGIEPDIANALGVSVAQAGQLVSSFALVYAIFTPVLALTTGRFRRYHLLVSYLVVFVAGNALSAVGTSFAAQLFSRVLMGLVSGALLAVAITYISDFVEERRVPGVLAALWIVGTNVVAALVVIMLIALLMYVPSTPCAGMFLDTARADYPKALTLAASIEPMAFNTGIAVGTAVGGRVVTGVGISAVGLFGALFALAAIVCLAMTQHFVTARRR